MDGLIGSDVYLPVNGIICSELSQRRNCSNIIHCIVKDQLQQAPTYNEQFLLHLLLAEKRYPVYLRCVYHLKQKFNCVLFQTEREPPSTEKVESLTTLVEPMSTFRRGKICSNYDSEPTVRTVYCSLRTVTKETTSY